MKRLFGYAAILSALLLTGCNSGSKQPDFNSVANSLSIPTVQVPDHGTLYCLMDNAEPKLMPTSLFPDAPDSLIEQLNLQGGIPASISTFLWHNNEGWALFDTGLGADHGGQMLNKLQQMGLSPDSITRIYLTHFHGDHIGGMLQDGQPIFKRAHVYANHLEYIHWKVNLTSQEAAQQHQVLDAYRDQLQLFAWGDSLPGGVNALDAPGHTPGHTVFRVGNVLILGDLMHGFDLQYNHRYISCNFDMDKDQAAQSRNHIISIAYNEHLTIAGMHLPDPSFFDVNPTAAQQAPSAQP